jgi:hypothetical protein
VKLAAAFWSAAIHRRFLFARPKPERKKAAIHRAFFLFARRKPQKKESGDESPHSKTSVSATLLR